MGLRWNSRRSDFAALLVSGVAAAFAPVQVFLLAYIVLGPFHYLTEVEWLRSRDFYIQRGVVSPRMYGALAGVLALAGAADYLLLRGLGYWIMGLLMLLSLSVWISNRYVLMAIAVAGVVTKVFSPGLVFLIAVGVPTLVHVFFFTWIFMTNGAIRSRDAGPRRWVNPGLMLAITAALVVAPMHYGALGGRWLRMEAVSFGPLVQVVAARLHHTVTIHAGTMDGNIAADPLVAGVLRVFAFAYLFHYLNWFGKKDLLGWHRISGRTWAVIGVLYAASLSLYGWNFKVGFMVANFLSLLHVLMEFPLDWTALRFVLLRRREPLVARAETVSAG
jgi:hypothetical protein